MKRIAIYLLALVSIMACGNDEDMSMYNDDSELSSLTMSEVLSSVKFVPDDSIGYVPEGGLTLFSNNSFKRYIQGYGWEHVGSYEITTDGTLAKEIFNEGKSGYAPPHYYFGERQMRVYSPPLLYEDITYQYSAEQHNSVYALYEEGPIKKDPIFPILYYNDEAKEMAILKIFSTPDRGGEEGARRIGYVVQFYQRLSQERLEEIRELYHTNKADKYR